MNILFPFVTNPEKTSYYGEDRDETIHYVVRQSLITLIPETLLMLILLGLPVIASPWVLGLTSNGVAIFSPSLFGTALLFWYLGVFGAIFQIFLSWFFNIFIISNKKIVDMDFSGILYKNISETPLRNVEDVTSTVKGALGVIFNIGEVFVQTAGEKPEFEFTKVDDPSAIRDLLSDLVEKVKGPQHAKSN